MPRDCRRTTVMFRKSNRLHKLRDKSHHLSRGSLMVSTYPKKISIARELKLWMKNEDSTINTSESRHGVGALRHISTIAVSTKGQPAGLDLWFRLLTLCGDDDRDLVWCCQAPGKLNSGTQEMDGCPDTGTTTLAPKRARCATCPIAH